MKNSAGYAESQIRVLLSALAGDNHGTRLKAIKTFMMYMNEFRPEVNDTDVDYLFQGGVGNGRLKNGLLFYAGQDSDKHEGQLKRIASPTITLITWLISLNIGEEIRIWMSTQTSLQTMKTSSTTSSSACHLKN